MPALWTRRTGPDARADRGRPLVLLHGLGATGETFAPLVDAASRRWPGPCVVVDLPGHGRSPWLPPYDVEHGCRAVADAVGDLRDAVVLGHSLGGVLALGLAAGAAGAVPAAAVAVSVKSAWTDDDVARAVALAARPRSRFDTEEQAAERFLKVAGLWGLADSPVLRRSGVAQDGDGWVLAQDPATNGFVPPDLTALVASAQCQVARATGAEDAMATPQMLDDVGPGGTVVPAAGHNLHVEAPAAVLDLVLQVTADL